MCSDILSPKDPTQNDVVLFLIYLYHTQSRIEGTVGLNLFTREGPILKLQTLEIRNIKIVLRFSL